MKFDLMSQSLPPVSLFTAFLPVLADRRALLALLLPSHVPSSLTQKWMYGMAQVYANSSGGITYFITGIYIVLLSPPLTFHCHRDCSSASKPFTMHRRGIPGDILLFYAIFCVLHTWFFLWRFNFRPFNPVELPPEMDGTAVF